MNVSDLLEALREADPTGPVVINVDHRQRPVDAVVMTDGVGTAVLLTDPADGKSSLVAGGRRAAATN